MKNEKELQVMQSKDPAPTMESALIEIVSRRDIDPIRLEKFLDLQIKMEDRQATKDLSLSLSMFQADCPIIRKTKKGHNNNYAPFDEIVHIIKPVMKKHGLSYYFNVKKIDDSTSELVTIIKHVSGAEFTTEWEFLSLDDGGKMNSSQRKKSALSYAKRAGIENALGLASAEVDDDANRAIDNPMTEDQRIKILDHCKNTGTDAEKLLKFLKVSSLDDLSYKEAESAIGSLKNKRKILVNRQDGDKL